MLATSRLSRETLLDITSRNGGTPSQPCHSVLFRASRRACLDNFHELRSVAHLGARKPSIESAQARLEGVAKFNLNPTKGLCR